MTIVAVVRDFVGFFFFFTLGKSPSEVFGLVSPGSERMFRSMSYGRLDLRLRPHLRWIRMSRESGRYGVQTFASHFEYIQVGERGGGGIVTESVAPTVSASGLLGLKRLIRISQLNAHYNPTAIF